MPTIDPMNFPDPNAQLKRKQLTYSEQPPLLDQTLNSLALRLKNDLFKSALLAIDGHDNENVNPDNELKYRFDLKSSKMQPENEESSKKIPHMLLYLDENGNEVYELVNMDELSEDDQAKLFSTMAQNMSSRGTNNITLKYTYEGSKPYAELDDNDTQYIKNSFEKQKEILRRGFGSINVTYLGPMYLYNGQVTNVNIDPNVANNQDAVQPNM